MTQQIIKYDDAVLDAGLELSGQDVKFSPFDNLIWLWHCWGDAGYFRSAEDNYDGSKLTCFAEWAAGSPVFSAAAPKFGTSNLLTGNSNLMPVEQFRDNLKNLLTGTVDFWLKDQWLSGSDEVVIARFGRWQVTTKAGDYNTYFFLNFGIWDDAGNQYLHEVQFPYSNQEWVHIRVTWDDITHTAKVFSDGVLVDTIELEVSIASDIDTQLDPALQIMVCAANAIFNLQEIRIYSDYRPDAFTPPTAITKPFADSQKKAVVIYDSGEVGKKWDTSTLGFLNEGPFSSGKIKIRLVADSSGEAGFTGDPLTLEAARALGWLSGQFVALELSLLGDGSEQITLTPGYISCASPVNRPMVEQFERVNQDGSCLVSGAEDEATIYCYGLNVYAYPPSLSLIGSRVGNGEMSLNFHDWNLPVFAATTALPLPVVFYSKLGDYYSQISSFVDPIMLTFDPVAQIDSYTRYSNYAELTLSAIPAGVSAVLFYINIAIQEIQSKMVVNGLNTITGLLPYVKYSMLIFGFSQGGTIYLPQVTGDGITLPPVGASIREKILSDLKLTLEGITQNNGYLFDVPLVYRPKAIPSELTEFPTVIVGAESDDENKVTTSKQEGRARFRIIAWHNREDDSTIQSLLAEIVRAVTFDPSRGGLAFDTRVKSKNTSLDNRSFPAIKPYGRVDIVLEIKYTTNYSDPYTQ